MTIVMDPRHPHLAPADQAALQVRTAKHQMRYTAQQRRASLFAQYVGTEQAGVQLRDSFLANCPLPPRATVAGYWPVNDEIDVRPLMIALAERGHPLAMPVVLNRQQPLRFRSWYPGLVMEPGRFGIPTPPDSFPEVRPVVVLVPLLAYDRAGYRLGRGSGYYDHTLKQLRAMGEVMAVGIAFAGQEVPAVPHNAFDQRLDWLVTEHGAFACGATEHPFTVFGALR